MIIVLVQMFIMLEEVVEVHGMLALGTLELVEMEEVVMVHTPIILVPPLPEKQILVVEVEVLQDKVLVQTGI
jgi:hypothetical protein